MALAMVPTDAAYCPHEAARREAVVYVWGDRAMGLCLPCKSVMEMLVQRRAHLDDVLWELTRLGYGRQDAARFHADMAGGLAHLWRRLVNPLRVLHLRCHLAPAGGKESPA